MLSGDRRCPYCERMVRGEKGLKEHIAAVHPLYAAIQDAVMSNSAANEEARLAEKARRADEAERRRVKFRVPISVGTLNRIESRVAALVAELELRDIDATAGQQLVQDLRLFSEGKIIEGGIR